MASDFLEGFVRYPDELPCPQADTDLVPRERRYISDITEVRNMRMFQQEFQATRNRIVFIFTEEEARQFREWYTRSIIHGGAWFYANWPTLHKDKNIAHRFVGQPKYEWLFGANPGAMGRSVAGMDYSVGPVTIYKVTATVELYEPRNVGKMGGGNVYTSKIYPIFAEDALDFTINNPGVFPRTEKVEKLALGLASVTAAKDDRVFYTEKYFDDVIRHSQIQVQSVEVFGGRKEGLWGPEGIWAEPATVIDAESKEKITYQKFVDSLSLQLATVIEGETS